MDALSGQHCVLQLRQRRFQFLVIFIPNLVEVIPLLPPLELPVYNQLNFRQFSQTNERERRLDVGLLQSGKFAEALAGLEKWLADTEDMVNNQKPPSADYKVVKAQLQEQKVC